MIPPKSYAEWIHCFERFKNGTEDNQVIALMKQGSIKWTKGVAERITDSLYETVKYRLNQISETFQKELNRSNGDELAIVKAMTSTRNRISNLNHLTKINTFPENVRDSLKELLSNYVKDTQKSLEDSAKTDRSGRLRMLIKNNSLLDYHHNDVDRKVVNNNNKKESLKTSTRFKHSKRRVIIK